MPMNAQTGSSSLTPKLDRDIFSWARQRGNCWTHLQTRLVENGCFPIGDIDEPLNKNALLYF